MEKIWCEHCNKYTYQTSGGCVECRKCTLNYKLEKLTADVLIYKRYSTGGIRW